MYKIVCFIKCLKEMWLLMLMRHLSQKLVSIKKRQKEVDVYLQYLEKERSDLLGNNLKVKEELQFSDLSNKRRKIKKKYLIIGEKNLLNLEHVLLEVRSSIVKKEDEYKEVEKELSNLRLKHQKIT